MSKQIKLFMESMFEKKLEAKKEYLEKLERVRKGKFIKISNLAQKYGL